MGPYMRELGRTRLDWQGQRELAPSLLGTLRPLLRPSALPSPGGLGSLYGRGLPR